jgi:hypothetical protein
MGQNKVNFITQFPEQIPGWLVMYALSTRGNAVIGKEYFARQAATLLNFAKTTRDPKVSAALIDKAADLKMQVDEIGEQDLTPLVPDVEPPTA